MDEDVIGSSELDHDYDDEYEDEDQGEEEFIEELAEVALGDQGAHCRLVPNPSSSSGVPSNG
jgi:hypothetical protein